LLSKSFKLSPSSVLELGCNVGGNLREISAIDPKVELNGIELNEQAIALGKSEVVPSAHFIKGSMANAAALFDRSADVVFTSAAAMHCDDDIFRRAKSAALKIALKAIIHLEFHAWTPADLSNARKWRSSFLSDRWMRDYIGEYQTHPRVETIEAKPIPFAINPADNIGRVMVNDVTGLIVVRLTP
jgi:SAM-dependent methyltransferase